MPVNSFMFHCDERYFSPYKVTKPFYLRVEYNYRDKTFLDVWNIEMSFNAIGALSLTNNLKEEIRSAAIDHHLKHIK